MTLRLIAKTIFSKPRPYPLRPTHISRDVEQRVEVDLIVAVDRRELAPGPVVPVVAVPEFAARMGHLFAIKKTRERGGKSIATGKAT